MAPEGRRLFLLGLPRLALEAVEHEWWWQAHGGQSEPGKLPDGSDWRIWSIVAGRGFGKTRAGAEWISQRARENSDARIALVAASLDEVAKVMVEGESGLLAIARADEELRWVSSRGTLYFPSGAAAFAYTAERPSKLRGPQHHFAWCDELAKWPVTGSPGRPRADECWDNLMLGLRLGDRPRTIVTTTPQTIPLLTRVIGLNRAVTTHGRTDENPHIAADFREAMREMYAGTRLGRQELDGILLADREGALWTREMLDEGRVGPLLPGTGRGTAAAGGGGGGGRSEHGGVGLNHHASAGPPPDFRVDLKRTILGVDPPATATGDACGIVVCGVDAAGIGYVVADLSVSGLRPEGWARRVADAAELFDVQKVVAEKNQGGDMVESVLRAACSTLPVKLVSAGKGKAARAEPIALRFETGRAKLAGNFPELEDELCALTHAGYQGPGSPDRADAMVWAMTELFEPKAAPRVRGL
jgi:phage terminase large subunit-like protein